MAVTKGMLAPDPQGEVREEEEGRRRGRTGGGGGRRHEFNVSSIKRVTKGVSNKGHFFSMENQSFHL